MSAVEESLFLSLPNELIQRVLLFCSIRDISSLDRTCKALHGLIRSDYIWQLQWPCLVKSANLQLSIPSTNTNFESYYACSHRLLRICYRGGKIGFNSLPPKCVYCGQKSCSSRCGEVQAHKLALDIGSKTTWLMTSGFFLERHPSLLVIPERDAYFENRPICSNETVNLQLPMRKVNCLLCHQEVDEMLRKQNQMGSQCSKQEQNLLEDCNEEPRKKSPVLNPVHPLMRQKFKLWSEISFMLRDANIEHLLLHPAQCFSGTEDFKYLEQYIYHLLYKFNMLKEIQKPNATLVFCEPFNCSMELRAKLSEFLIETLQVTRICFLNKGLAAAMLFEVETGLVIDSGARNTVLTVIINGKVQSGRTQSCPIGGTEIAQRLADAIQLSGLKNNVYFPSLDSSRVKSRCFLSLNPSLDEKKGHANKRRVFVRCIKKGPGPHLEEIKLGSELFLAPEIMYTAMDLPNKLKTALRGLEPSVIEDLLSHIVLTGSNTELKGFSTRLTRDLQVSFPEHRHKIFIRSNGGSHSWDAVTGAMQIPIVFQDSNSLPLDIPTFTQVPASIMWVTREDYILKGFALFGNA